MSESGEISEFGYIMELLARGKVSAGKSGAAPRPSSGHYLAGSCGRPGSFQGGGWDPGCARSAPASWQLQNAE